MRLVLRLVFPVLLKNLNLFGKKPRTEAVDGELVAYGAFLRVYLLSERGANKKG